MKLIIILIISEIFTINCFSQSISKTYESVYELENKYKANTKDTSNSYSFNLEMKASYKIFSNENFSFIIAKVEDINIPLELHLTNDTILVDFNKSMMYIFSEKIAKHIRISKSLKKNDSVEMINNYRCSLNEIKYSNNHKVFIWSTNKIPWYVNPGIFHDKSIGAITKISTDKSLIILKKVKVSIFNFMKAVKKANKFKIVEKEIDTLELL